MAKTSALMLFRYLTFVLALFLGSISSHARDRAAEYEWPLKSLPSQSDDGCKYPDISILHSTEDMSGALAGSGDPARNTTLAVDYYLRAIGYVCKKQYDQAIKDLTEAIKFQSLEEKEVSKRGASYDYLYVNKALELRAAIYDQLGDTASAGRDRENITENYKNAATEKQAEQQAVESNQQKLYGQYGSAPLPQAQVATTPPPPAPVATPKVSTAPNQPSTPPTTTDASSPPQVQEANAALPAATQAPTASAPTPAVAPLPADQGKRIALVIGNSAYRTVNPLRNPANDAHAVAEEFRRLGFAEVIEKHDLSLLDLSAALKDFGDKAVDADWAVVYYAGHGIEVGGVNYVIPVDAELKTSAHVEEEAIPLDRVLSKVEGAHQLRLVILDACRDNPFAQRLANASGGTRSVGRGLARVEPVGGVMVAYSARDGHLAQDGDAANSPFAQALVQNLEQPGVEIGLVFRKVHDEVLNATHGEQEPFTYGALPAEALYFKAAAQ